MGLKRARYRRMGLASYMIAAADKGPSWWVNSDPSNCLSGIKRPQRFVDWVWDLAAVPEQTVGRQLTPKPTIPTQVSRRTPSRQPSAMITHPQRSGCVDVHGDLGDVVQ